MPHARHSAALLASRATSSPLTSPALCPAPVLVPLARPEAPQTVSVVHSGSALNRQLSKTACRTQRAIAPKTASTARSDSRCQAIALAAAKLVSLVAPAVSDAWPAVPVPALLVALRNT